MVEALRSGACIVAPPIYYIGPLIAEAERGGGGRAGCLEWLDSQLSWSVVFLCFGSLGLFFAAQREEIAIGLERSGQRFLWVELGAGGAVLGGADGGLAAVRGAAAEPVGGGGDGAGVGCGEGEGWVGGGGGGGETCQRWAMAPWMVMRMSPVDLIGSENESSSAVRSSSSTMLMVGY